MTKSRLAKPTLFFVVSILMSIYILFEWIVAAGTVEGWLYRMVNSLLPVAITLLIMDVLLKYLIKSLRVIWLIEVVLFTGLIYYWIIS